MKQIQNISEQVGIKKITNVITQVINERTPLGRPAHTDPNLTAYGIFPPTCLSDVPCYDKWRRSPSKPCLSHN